MFQNDRIRSKEIEKSTKKRLSHKFPHSNLSYCALSLLTCNLLYAIIIPNFILLFFFCNNCNTNVSRLHANNTYYNIKVFYRLVFAKFPNIYCFSF
jgi:hypothetical protein